ncbi:MAG: hypothetical protein ACJASM_002773, partial [Salibacteraceae bacterium]
MIRTIFLLVMFLIVSTETYSQKPIDNWRVHRCLKIMRDDSFNKARIERKIGRIKYNCEYKESIEELYIMKKEYIDFYKDTTLRLGRFYRANNYRDAPINIKTPQAEVEELISLNGAMLEYLIGHKENRSELNSRYDVSRYTIESTQKYLLELLDKIKDSDGDGVLDINDECPFHVGLKKNRGCSDADDDGIVDINDSCPDKKGLIEFLGCPRPRSSTFFKDTIVSMINDGYKKNRFEDDSIRVNAFVLHSGENLFIGFESYNVSKGMFELGEYTEDYNPRFINFCNTLEAMDLDEKVFLYGSILGEADAKPMPSAGILFKEEDFFNSSINMNLIELDEFSEEEKSRFTVNLQDRGRVMLDIELAGLRVLYGKTILGRSLPFLTFDSLYAIGHTAHEGGEFRKLSILMIFADASLADQEDFLIKYGEISIEKIISRKPSSRELDGIIEKKYTRRKVAD